MDLEINLILQQAITSYQKGRFEEAEKNYEKVIELKPDHIEAYYELGNAQFKLNKFEDAEKNYKKR